MSAALRLDVMEMKSVDFLRSYFQRCEPGDRIVLMATSKMGAVSLKHLRNDEWDVCEDWINSRSHSHNIYFGMAPLVEGLSDRQKGSVKDVVALTSLWIDIDFGYDAHKSKKNPADEKQAIDLIGAFPLEPSILIRSGHGFHAHFLFDKCLRINSEEDRNKAKDLSSGFFRAMNGLAVHRGFQLDSVQNLDRILRVPGTRNFKANTERDVELVYADFSRRYSLEDLLSEYGGSQRSRIRRPRTRKHIVSHAEKMLNTCEFLKYCHDEAEALPEPHWFAMITTLAGIEGGESMIHLLSERYPGYSDEETQTKTDRVCTSYESYSCKRIGEIHPGICDGCPVRGKAMYPRDVVDIPNETSNKKFQAVNDIVSILESHFDVGDKIGYNEFNQRLTLKEDIQLSSHTLKKGDWDDDYETVLRSYVESVCGAPISKTQMSDAVKVLGLKNCNKFNPVVERLKSYEECWDGVNRIDTFLVDYFGGIGNEAYLRFVSQILFLGPVTRAMEPGSQVDLCPILESQEQGTAKTTFCRILGGDYFTETFFGANHRTIESMQGKWIFEIGEIDRLLTDPKSNSEMKNFLTAMHDDDRLAYRRNAKRYPRQSFFIGTTNLCHYLTDFKNRRFLPVTVKQLDVERFKETLPQLLGEAVARYRNGAKCYNRDEALDVIIRAEQDQRRLLDPVEAEILAYMDGKESATMVELIEHLVNQAMLDLRYDRSTVTTIGHIMTAHGFKKKRGSDHTGHRLGRYYRP